MTDIVTEKSIQCTSIPIDSWRNRGNTAEAMDGNPTVVRNNRRPRVVRSFGIACVRRGLTGYEILLVKKRVSYAFSAFVRGCYNSSNSAEMIKLFSGMTIDEKQDILSLNFGYIWYRTWLDTAQLSHKYHVAKSKYENTFFPDNGSKLRRMMKLSATSHRLWEIPKGKKQSSAESDVHCAIREFSEETGVAKSKYKITAGIKLYNYVDDGVEYCNKYIIAVAIAPFTLTVNLDNRAQSGEISEVNWMTLGDVRRIDSHGCLSRVVREIFNYLRKNNPL